MKMSKILNRCFTKKDTQMANKHTEKKILNSTSHKEIAQWSTSTHLFEWLQFKSLATTNVSKDLEELECSNIPTGNTKWYHRCGKQCDTFLQS